MKNNPIQIHKFGGASVQNADAVKQVANILKQHTQGARVLVISAMAKTTNALEKVAQQHFDGHTEQSLQTLRHIKIWHRELIEQLFAERPTAKEKLLPIINDLFVEVEWVLEEDSPENYNFLYDQIVPLGELLSTHIVTAFLQSEGLPASWMDARDLIRTDESYREGRIQWQKTIQKIRQHVLPKIQKNELPTTQGFIGSTQDNYNTTLGREGSDYTAAILGYALDAQSVTIWKDVPGILTADPRIFQSPPKLDLLSYREAIEMTYYGAQVIHPKTIKPLQNKNIPLKVRSFLQPEGNGSLIRAEVEEKYPPIISIKQQQALLQISTRDFSFVTERHIGYLFNQIANLRIQVNLMQNSAISFSLCITDNNKKADKLINQIQDAFKVQIQRGLELINVRHARPNTRDELLKDRLVLLEQRLGNTLQMVVRKIEPVKYKK